MYQRITVEKIISTFADLTGQQPSDNMDWLKATWVIIKLMRPQGKANLISPSKLNNIFFIFHSAESGHSRYTDATGWKHLSIPECTEAMVIIQSMYSI